MSETNPMLAALAAVYGEPDSADPKAFLAVYSRLMRFYTRSECEEAADVLLKRRKKYKTWPVPADCIEVLDEVRKRKREALQAAEMQQRIEAQKAEPKPVSPAEQREAERFVDAWADGKRQLIVPKEAPPAKKLEMGLLSASLRRMAQQMRDKRRARA